MKHKITLSAILFTLCFTTAPYPLNAETSNGILVKFRSGTRTAKMATTHKAARGVEKKYFRHSGIRLIQPAPGSSTDSTLLSYRNSPDILFAVANRTVRKAAFTPDDPLFPQQWWLNNTGQTSTGFYGTYTGSPGADIAARTAWETTTGSSSVIVATLDTGIDLYHPDLTANIWTNSGESSCSDGIDNDGNGYVDDCHGWNFAKGNSNVLDDDFDFHGTHVAGIIAASGNNGTGVIGVAPSVRIMPLKILDSAGYGDMAGIVAAVEYAISKGAGIINASYTYPQFCEATDADPAELEALKAAEKAGVLIIAAAGNYSCNNDRLPFYPAGHQLPNIISVGASTPLDSYAIFSNRGNNTVHIAAPGVNILSTVLNSSSGYYSGLTGYEILSGTSMAAPVVSGIASLVKSAHPDYSYLQTREAILLGADPKNFPVSSGGRANAANAVALDLAKSPPYQPSSLSLLNLPDNSIELSWVDNASRNDGFIVERRLNTGAFLPLATLPPKTVIYRDTAVMSGEQLATYRVKAFNSSGESPYSAEMQTITALAAPTALSVSTTGTAEVLLSWTNNSSSHDGFKIERRNGDTGEFVQIDTTEANITYYSDKALPSGSYTYRVRAYITNSTMSAYSNEATVSIAANGGSGCFIATAAYGSYLHPKVRLLREFRDNYLLTNRPGKAFVALYYRYSPGIAEVISGNAALRLVTRWLLTPLVMLIEYPAMTGLLCVGLLLWGRLRRRAVKSAFTVSDVNF